MKKIYIIFYLIFSISYSYADEDYEKYFHVGIMKSYDDLFTLHFKTREKSILARGENLNYINDYPQDLYIYNHITKEDLPLISYEWFPKKVKKILKTYNYPLFPEDFAYYLLGDSNTLVMVSAKKTINRNLEFNIKKRELKLHKGYSKLDFIISAYAKNCGYKNIKSKYKCDLFKPLISNNLIN